MFGVGFDILIAVLSGVCAVLLLTGHGDFVLTLFAGKSKKDEPLPYEKKKYCIVMGLLCIPIFISSLGMIFFPENGVVVIGGLVLIIVSWIIGIAYLRKYAKVDVPKKDSINKRVKNLQKK